MTQHRDPDDPISPVEGPSPTDEDADEGETLEDFISGLDRPMGAEDHTTAEEQSEGDSIDERTRREQPQRTHPRQRFDLEDTTDGGVDPEGELLAWETEAFGPEAPEQAAMHIQPDAPGGVDHPDDYVIDDGS